MDGSLFEQGNSLLTGFCYTILFHNINSLLTGKHFHSLQKFAETLIMKNVIMLTTNENIKELMAR